jgi:hypothetical protein
MSQRDRALQCSLKQYGRALAKYQCFGMAYGGALVFPETQKKSQKMKKVHPECIKNGENATEGRRRLMDH